AHALLDRLLLRCVAVEQHGGDEVVAVGEDVGFDGDVVVLHALGRKGAAVDARLHSLVDDAGLAVESHAGRGCQRRARQRSLRRICRTRNPRTLAAGPRRKASRRTSCSPATKSATRPATSWRFAYAVINPKVSDIR